MIERSQVNRIRQGRSKKKAIRTSKQVDCVFSRLGSHTSTSERALSFADGHHRFGSPISFTLLNDIPYTRVGLVRDRLSRSNGTQLTASHWGVDWNFWPILPVSFTFAEPFFFLASQPPRNLFTLPSVDHLISIIIFSWTLSQLWQPSPQNLPEIFRSCLSANNAALRGSSICLQEHSI